MAIRRRAREEGPSEKTITVAQLRAVTEESVRVIHAELVKLDEALSKGDEGE